jgi:hypothetical protein
MKEPRIAGKEKAALPMAANQQSKADASNGAAALLGKL